MKLKKTEWETADDCTACGHQGMTFKLKGWNGKTNKKYWGVLSCPACYAVTPSYCDEDMIPEEARA